MLSFAGHLQCPWPAHLDADPTQGAPLTDGQPPSFPLGDGNWNCPPIAVKPGPQTRCVISHEGFGIADEVGVVGMGSACQHPAAELR